MKVGTLHWDACNRCEHMTEKGCEIKEFDNGIEIDYEFDAVLCFFYRIREDYAEINPAN